MGINAMIGQRIFHRITIIISAHPLFFLTLLDVYLPNEYKKKKRAPRSVLQIDNTKQLYSSALLSREREIKGLEFSEAPTRDNKKRSIFSSSISLHHHCMRAPETRTRIRERKKRSFSRMSHRFFGDKWPKWEEEKTPRERGTHNAPSCVSVPLPRTRR